MKRIAETRKSITIGSVLFFFILMAVSPAFGGVATITGQVNDSSQIEAEDGTLYDIADTDLGAEVADQLGKKVKVKGDVEEKEGAKTITVSEYEVIE